MRKLDEFTADLKARHALVGCRDQARIKDSPKAVSILVRNYSALARAFGIRSNISPAVGYVTGTAVKGKKRPAANKPSCLILVNIQRTYIGLSLITPPRVELDTCISLGVRSLFRFSTLGPAFF